MVIVTIKGPLVSTALLTDHYELTMLDAALRDGSVDRTCVFEAFARRLPAGRRYGVVAGLERVVDAIGAFHFGDAELSFLAERDVVSPATLTYLASYRFTGDLHAYREGEVYFPDSPVLTVQAPFGQAVVLETLILSILNHDSAVASAAARMVVAAQGRDLLEFGGRRTHEEAAVAAARAAYVAGFAATSNLEAGRRYGIPTAGTAAHAFTLVHDDEPAAFRSQVAALGADTTLLVDTFDIGRGLQHALAAGGKDLGAVRIDSGDLAVEAKRARDLLDTHGATATRIVLSGDLDEYAITDLQSAPADAYGVGTSVVTGSGAPTAGFVYKLVARSAGPGEPLEPVAKSGGVKATVGAKKSAHRRLHDGVAVAEVLGPWERDPDRDERPLQVEALRDGEVVHRPNLAALRAHHRRALSELPPEARDVTDGGPALPTELRED